MVSGPLLVVFWVVIALLGALSGLAFLMGLKAA